MGLYYKTGEIPWILGGLEPISRTLWRWGESRANLSPY
jgi:hypothetical protein